MSSSWLAKNREPWRPIYLALSSQDLGHYFRRRYQVCDNSDQALRERLSDRFEQP